MTDNRQPQDQKKEIEILKEYLEDYLQTTSYYNPNRKYANKFLCRNPEHNEARPSMSLNYKNKKYIHCFSCNASYSIIDLVIMDYELGDLNKPLEERLKDSNTIAQACSKIKELFNISGDGATPHKKEYKPQPQKPTINLQELNKKGVCGNPTREYMSSRGITSNNLIQLLELKNTYEGENGLLYIPYQIRGAEPQTITSRVISVRLGDINSIPKELRYKHYGAMTTYDPFNYLAASKPRVVFITEGEIDTISYYQALEELRAENYKPSIAIGSIALGGINNNKDLIKKLKEIDTTSLYLVLALDNDDRGKQATRDLANVFNDMSLKYTIANIPSEYKDSNDYLKGSRDGFKAYIKDFTNNIENYCTKTNKELLEAISKEIERDKTAYINNNSVLNYLNTFIDHRANPTRPIQSYFTKLDSIIGGGFREGLITIGAVSSLGKTSFILQLADQIAQSRQTDILYYSLEMATDELIAKSLSRLMYLNCENHTERVKTQTQILNSSSMNKEELELFNKSLLDYKSYAKNLYFKEGVYNLGVEDIKKAALEHKEKTAKAPLIIIDYLQILAAPKDKSSLSDKQKTDENILQLKQLSRDLKTPIIVISSLNRASYSQEVSLSSFKESGAIEYTSDIILGLNYKLSEAELKEVISLKSNEDFRKLPDGEKEKQLEDLYKSFKAKTPRNIKLDILKNRNGGNFTSVSYQFYPQYNYFLEEACSLTTHRELLEHSRAHSGDNELFIELPF